ncbi:MAG: hypothetical protein PVI54_04030 [Desulfobacteraceae bacterium]|jgi:hypothetical protein
MTSKLNQRWLIVGAIWLAVLVMTSLNFSRIDAVARSRESAERLRKELVFQHRNSVKLHKVKSLHLSHFKPVASVKLGFESARSSLHALAALLGMENVKIESGMAQATSEQIPLLIRMRGGSDKAMGFVTALATYPYLSVRHSRIVVQNAQGVAEIDIELLLNFKIEPQQESETTALQASAPSQERGVHPQ